jgi:hypothetical protein
VKRAIAFCPCGNLSQDGLNFERVEGAIPTLKCARCGAVGSDFEYVPRPKVDALRSKLQEEVERLRAKSMHNAAHRLEEILNESGADE